MTKKGVDSGRVDAIVARKLDTFPNAVLNESSGTRHISWRLSRISRLRSRTIQKIVLRRTIPTTAVYSEYIRLEKNVDTGRSLPR